MDDLVPLGTLSKPHDSSNEQRTCDAVSSLACVPMHVERPSDAVEVADSTSATAHVSAKPSHSRSSAEGSSLTASQQFTSRITSPPPIGKAPPRRPEPPPSSCNTVITASAAVSTSDADAVGLPSSPSSRAAGKQPMHHPLPSAAAVQHTTSADGSSSTQYQAGQPRKVLHIFSGVADRIDGFAAMMLGLYKVEVVEYDTLISADFDLTDSKVLAALLARIHLSLIHI